MIDFAYPFLLLLLLALPAILLISWRRKEPSLRVPFLPLFQRKNADGKIVRTVDLRRLVPFLCYTLAAVLIVFALARPRSGREVLRSATEGIDIIIALDISGSMLSYDAPAGYSRNRIAREISNGVLRDRINTAKTEIAAFIRSRPGDRIGLIQFADGPDLVCPPTLDHAWLLSVLASLKPEPEMLGTRTGIAAPLVEAADSLKASPNAIIVLFTDGRDNVEAPVTPDGAAKHAADRKIRIYTVGIGSGNTYVINNGLFGGAYLQPVEDEFDEPLLKRIASVSGGRYYTAADPAGMAAAMKEIDTLEKVEGERTTTVYAKEWYPALALAAAACLLLGFALQRCFLLKLP